MYFNTIEYIFVLVVTYVTNKYITMSSCNSSFTLLISMFQSLVAVVYDLEHSLRRSAECSAERSANTPQISTQVYQYVIDKHTETLNSYLKSIAQMIVDGTDVSVEMIIGIATCFKPDLWNDALLNTIFNHIEYNKHYSNGRTILYYAVHDMYVFGNIVRNYESICINNRDDNGNTVLHHIINQGTQETPNIVHILLNHGADPNICNNNGDTPLHCLVASNCHNVDNHDIWCKLIKYGADPNIRNNIGVSATQ